MGEFNLSNVVSIRATEHENIVTRIKQVARIQANKTALVGQAATLSYGDMISSANRLAGLLQSKGVGPEVAVGVCIPRGPDAIIAFLAILKAGGVYVPLDSKHPHKRLEFMVQDSEATVLICTDETEAFVEGLAANVSRSTKIVN